ncbi:hypothetical protein AKJ49_00810 [candidate division MSBL1 archaeon SCGC-AAA382A03]|uniref:SSD domain-containing protein n=1 Tax=candidate division MSBL1 archaeon SCGC-AAA382A03 TaxID=1698278 RepID=A0A133VG55_9EURY|nr:hypothetical protein AKJ49_00810 [candidate division MSBL1 archaeon SCGC-AAA382A03]
MKDIKDSKMSKNAESFDINIEQFLDVSSLKHHGNEYYYYKSPKNAISDTVQSTGRAILSAAATTIGVFVIISFSSTPMLVSFGWLSAVVISFSLVGSLIILPLILFYYAKHEGDEN